MPNDDDEDEDEEESTCHITGGIVVVVIIVIVIVVVVVVPIKRIEVAHFTFRTNKFIRWAAQIVLFGFIWREIRSHLPHLLLSYCSPCYCRVVDERRGSRQPDYSSASSTNFH